jgi:hypothetical protein
VNPTPNFGSMGTWAQWNVGSVEKYRHGLSDRG